MTFDQWLHNLRQALGVQEQQIRIVSGALLFLLCIVLWERNQWTQPARSDLLYDLPQAQSSATVEPPITAVSSNTDFSQTWSCQHSKNWFLQQPHRWHEFEALAELLCHLDAANKATDELSFTADQLPDCPLYRDIVKTADRYKDLPQLIEQVQARIVQSEEAYKHSKDPPEGSGSTPTPSGPLTWIIFKRALSGLGLYNTTSAQIPAALLEAKPVPLKFQEYSEAHPVKALVGLNALMTSPRLFNLIMNCSNSRFRPGNIKQLLLAKAANQPADVPKHLILFFFKRPIIGNLLTLLLPGIQTYMYGQACQEDNPYLGRWLIVMGLTYQAVEIWSLYMLLDVTVASSDMANSFLCTHVVLPIFNMFLSIIFMLGVSLISEPNYTLVVTIEAVVLPLMTLWSQAIVGLPQRGVDNPAPPAQEGRQVRNAFVAAWNAAVENAGLPAEAAGRIPDMPQLPDPAPAREHRNRDRDHNRKEVHWPPPLIVPEHLEDMPEIPDSFKCPITFAIMKEPATTRNGLTYDRPAIMRWIEQHRRDPTTAQKLKAHHLSPNLSLRTVIQSWIDTHR